MATSLYSEIESDLRVKGDYVLIDGTLTATGATVLSSTLNVSGASTLAEGVTLSSPAVTATKTLTVNSKMTTHTGLKLATSTTQTEGLAWNTATAPVLTAGQSYLVVTCGATDYRIPVWLNA